MSDSPKYRHFTNAEGTQWRWDGEKLEVFEDRWTPSYFDSPEELQECIDHVEEVTP